MTAPLLRAPPFSSRPVLSQIVTDWDKIGLVNDIVPNLGRAILSARVGGAFWYPSPPVVAQPGGLSLVITPDHPTSARVFWRQVLEGEAASRLLLVLPRMTGGFAALAAEARGTGSVVVEAADPHALLDLGRDIHLAAMTDLGVLGLLTGLAVFRHDGDAVAREDPHRATAWIAQGTLYTDPFTGAPTSCLETIELLAEWRRMMLRNRAVGVCAGMSLWKRRRIAQFFVTGAQSPPFSRRPADAVRVARKRGGAVAVWSTRIPAGLEDMAANANVPLHRVEDGFIRSLGLGSDLLPPASIIVDRQGIYFDPSRPSDLETLLATAAFDAPLRARAKNLIDLLVRQGISKYAAGGTSPQLKAKPGQRIILVPGQVADDLSVRLGGGAIRGNADLLAQVRGKNPDAFIVYRPHPDVEAGHRPGAIPEPLAAGLADQVSRGGAMALLLGAVDEVHTLTSLAGFEALLRGRRVETYGQPFYSGWGLTTDHAQVTERRHRQLTIEDLVAATLILYPRYVDPQTGLLCGPETLIARLGDPALWRPSLLMRLRRLQGRARRQMGRRSPSMGFPT